MTQQQFYPQQQPQFPQFPGQQQPFPQQQAPQQPSQPLAEGTLDDYFNQPSSGGGPAVSWKNKPDGYAVAGIVPRDVTNADVQQDTDPQTKQPKFYRDGRPQFVMKVPLQVQASPDFPEGEASLYVRGQLRDELVRAMGEAGCAGAPVAGAGIVVTLVERRQGQGTIPKNIFAVRYAPPEGQQPAQPAPVPSGAEQAAQPAEQPTQQAPQMPVEQPTAPAPAPPAQPQQEAPKPPSDLSEDQQALLARLTGQ